ncbi:MAG TPA: rhodanese-like domain-containing protein [Vicinamibacteria bacterium]|nr:rhodanese-like domain-containing protein [Vicinamibacteria bacterium]
MDAKRWTVEDVAARIDRGEGAVFVDAREPAAWAASDVTIPGAVHIPVDELGTRADALPRGRSVVTYSGGGDEGESEKAAVLLAERGFDAHPLRGGFDAWRRAGLTVQAKARPRGRRRR